jgi:hypothetical protein
MSRGPGVWQRRILNALAEGKMVGLRGATRSQTASILRAAKQLERAGKCVIVRLWDDDGPARRRVIPSAFRPDAKIDGRPVQELNVARVPCGTRTAFKGSIRQLAWHFRVSKTTVWRDLRKTE